MLGVFGMGLENSVLNFNQLTGRSETSAITRGEKLELLEVVKCLLLASFPRKNDCLGACRTH